MPGNLDAAEAIAWSFTGGSVPLLGFSIAGYPSVAIGAGLALSAGIGWMLGRAPPRNRTARLRGQTEGGRGSDQGTDGSDENSKNPDVGPENPLALRVVHASRIPGSTKAHSDMLRAAAAFRGATLAWLAADQPVEAMVEDEILSHTSALAQIVALMREGEP